MYTKEPCGREVEIQGYIPARRRRGHIRFGGLSNTSYTAGSFAAEGLAERFPSLGFASAA